MSETGDIITRIYGGFRGVDFRGEEINLSRSPDSVNMWKDYKETESIRTRPAMKEHTAFGNPVNGIFFYKGMMIVYSGTELYRVKNGVKTLIASNIGKKASNGFVYADVFYFMDGVKYYCYDGTIFKEVEPYVPTTSIGRNPTDGASVSGGKVHEDVNFLTGQRINTFLGDKNNKVFFLDRDEIDSVDEVTVNDNVLEDTFYSVNLKKGSVEILVGSIDLSPETDGQDNISIKFTKTIDGYADKILKCTLVQVFDNRVFVSGNPDYPNFVWHCSLDDPTYFSDYDYYREGMDEAPIKGIVAGNNALWVFRESSDANTNVFYHTPAEDMTYGKIYPSSHSSVTIGCIGKAINFNDDIVFFSERGMEGISGDITTEQVAAHRSTLVDRKLIGNTTAYKNMIFAEWEGYLLVFIGNKVFLADSRAMFTNENHIEYDWFYWELEKDITCATVRDGVLYLGTTNGIYTLNDYAADVESYWVTPKDKFKSPNKLKTTNKRGCVVEATGDISVYAKTDKTDFELIGTYEDIEDSFTSRIKRKKFKDIQLKFASNTRFSFETATLEAFVGGYIKR